MHTNIALAAGLSKEDINQILNGDTSSIPVDNAIAVMFGQHYAGNREKPTKESIDKIIDEYGIQKAELIMAACCVITMTNGMGIGMDLLWSRLRFKRDKSSNLLSEIFNPLLTMILFPTFTIFNYIRRMFNKVHLIKNSVGTYGV